MQDAMIFGMLIGLVIGSLIGGIVLKLLAKYVGKVDRAKYWNSVLVTFLSSIVYLIVTFSLGTDLLKIGIGGIIVFNLVFLSVLYISFGKLIWKCSWLQSFKSNIIWIVLYTIVSAMMFGNSSI
jgi:uncharacterized membrane protein YhaH (DUF805 family)